MEPSDEAAKARAADTRLRQIQALAGRPLKAAV